MPQSILLEPSPLCETLPKQASLCFPPTSLVNKHWGHEVQFSYLLRCSVSVLTLLDNLRYAATAHSIWKCFCDVLQNKQGIRRVALDSSGREDQPLATYGAGRAGQQRMHSTLLSWDHPQASGSVALEVAADAAAAAAAASRCFTLLRSWLNSCGNGPNDNLFVARREGYLALKRWMCSTFDQSVLWKPCMASLSRV